jgi:gluconokinase
MKCNQNTCVVIVVMGVSGAGKSSVGRALAERLGWTFHDADDLHPPGNIDKMRRGLSLDDADRAPWLDRVRQAIAADAAAGRDAVVACSALKARYREALDTGIPGVRWVHLTAPADVLRDRLTSRHGHYMPAALLDSQLRDLEPPAGALVLDARLPVGALVERIVASL